MTPGGCPSQKKVHAFRPTLCLVHPARHLVVTCNIVARHNTMAVQYFTMTGTRFGDPILFNTKNPVLMRNLVARARCIALWRPAITPYFSVRVLIHGNAKLISGKRLRCNTDLAHRNLNLKLAELVQ